MSYRISRATWNGGLHPGYCCHCGSKNVHSSGTGLLCSDCFQAVCKYDPEGHLLDKSRDEEVAL